MKYKTINLSSITKGADKAVRSDTFSELLLLNQLGRIRLNQKRKQLFGPIEIDVLNF